MYAVLDHYQKEGYHALMDIAKQFGGAFLCDGVGLGKTFIGLMAIERLVIHDGKRVALFVPKTARVDVWERGFASGWRTWEAPARACSAAWSSSTIPIWDYGSTKTTSSESKIWRMSS